MKKITIEVQDEIYDKIKNLSLWVNLNNDVKNRDKPDDYNINEIATGLLIKKVKEIDHFNAVNPLSQYNVNKDTIIRNRFKEFSKRKNVKQIDIANQLKMNKSNLNYIFNNEKQPRMDTFLKIWAILGCPPLHECIYFED